MLILLFFEFAFIIGLLGAFAPISLLAFSFSARSVWYTKISLLHYPAHIDKEKSESKAIGIFGIASTRPLLS